MRMARAAARRAALVADSRRLRRELMGEVTALGEQAGRLRRGWRLALRCLALGRWVGSIRPHWRR